MPDDADKLIAEAREAQERFAETLSRAGLDQARLGAAATRLRSRLPARRLREADEQVAGLLDPIETDRRRPAGSSRWTIPAGVKA